MIGTVLNGRYQIVRRLGSGGMSTVYQGLDLQEIRYVAVKVLKEQYIQDEEFIRRFRREAEAVSRLNHPNIVLSYGVGEDQGHPYIIMEYVEGETLKEKIVREAPMPVDEAIHIAVQICRALEYAHEHQIVHRDIKPHNVLISTKGEVKVTDFGIARASSEATITHTGSVLGSVHYFSPEQAKGTAVNAQSDLYSLGVVFYEMLTGRVPFSGETPVTVALKHIQEPYLPLRHYDEKIPQSVENILTRMLAKDTKYRYPDAKTLSEDLSTALDRSRQNESPLVLPGGEDEEATRVMPALKLGAESGKSGTFFGNEEVAEKLVRRRWHWFFRIFWVLLALSLVVVGWFFVDSIKAQWVVPEVETPNVVGLPLDKAAEALEVAGLTNYEVNEVESETVPAGEVIRQDPPGLLTVKQDRTVRLWVSDGPGEMLMPNVMFKTRQDAVAELENHGFQEIRPVNEHSARVPPDQVIRQKPGPDSQVSPAQTTVELVISSGPDTFEMKNLVGKSLETAEKALKADGLALGQVHPEASPEKEGTVIQQYPYEPGDPVTPGAEVDLWVSTGLDETSNAEKTIQKLVEVQAEVPVGHPVQVQILVTDGSRDGEMVVNETISESKTFPVTVSYPEGGAAELVVLYDGEEVRRISVN